MIDYASIRGDFEASFQFLSAEEGGRKTSWISQGYRPDFSYENEFDQMFMIWPIFINEHGEPFPEGTILSTEKPLQARMVIVNPELRVTEHRSRVKIGLVFFVREGWRIVAQGVVTQIVDLFKD